jgi:hypothetical protein
MQENIMTYTTNSSVAALKEVFGERLITHGFWPHRFLRLDLCDYYLWGH